MMFQRPLVPLALCAAVASMVPASSEAASEPLAAMAAYARFAHGVLQPVAAAQKNHQRSLQFAGGRWTQMASMCGAAGGSFLDGRCEICPGEVEDGCCFINLSTFDFSCDICEAIGGVRECAEVECSLTSVGGYTCDGCGDYSSGEACFNFECDGNGACACNTITWNDEDCGECVIDENGNPSFDCTNVGGPDGTEIGAVEDMNFPDVVTDSPGENPSDSVGVPDEAPANDTTSAASDNAVRTTAGSLLLCGAVVALAVM